jgi:phytol kinase
MVLPKRKKMHFVFLANVLIRTVCLWIISYGTGSLVFYKDVKANYTRKINHFSLFFIPIYLDTIFPYKKSIESVVMGCLLGVSSLIIYIHPVRSRSHFVNRMFLSFDRPEDRPHTLKWLSTQVAAGYLIIIPMIILFTKIGHSDLIIIPILINGIGDGLAEPVGIRFGRLKYRTYALFSKREYVRTLEGSACVLITGIIVILLFRSSFSHAELICALIVVPMAMTIAEAFAPHTWDTPFLFFSGYVTLYLIKYLPFG